MTPQIAQLPYQYGVHSVQCLSIVGYKRHYNLLGLLAEIYTAHCVVTKATADSFLLTL